MKKKIGLLVILMFLAFILISCNNKTGGGPSSPKEAISTYFVSSNNIPSRNVGGSNVEFFVNNLLVVADDGLTAGWLIGNFMDSGGNMIHNTGWYDVGSINKTSVIVGMSTTKCSCVRLDISTVKINGIEINSSGMQIIAGDLSKLGSHEFVGPDVKEIDTFDGVDDLYNDVNEFIVVVDEPKLHNNGTLKSDWWKCFSFITR